MIDYRTRIYDKYASRFQDAVATFRADEAARWGRPYARYLAGWLPADADAEIVDLACGHGKLLHCLRQRGFANVRGVDRSPEQVAIARQTGIPVDEADVLDFLGGHRGRFDLITALDLVEHFRKEEVLAFLDLCHGALRPGGRLVLQTPNADSPFGAQHRYNDFTHEVAFNPNALCRLLALCGFSEVEAREQGPVAHGLASGARCLAWGALRLGLLAWNLAETGSKGSGVLTRVFLCSGVRP